MWLALRSIVGFFLQSFSIRDLRTRGSSLIFLTEKARSYHVLSASFLLDLDSQGRNSRQFNPSLVECGVPLMPLLIFHFSFKYKFKKLSWTQCCFQFLFRKFRSFQRKSIERYPGATVFKMFPTKGWWDSVAKWGKREGMLGHLARPFLKPGEGSDFSPFSVENLCKRAVWVRMFQACSSCVSFSQ